MSKPIPTGEQMVKNKPRIEDLVKDLLIKHPQARGDDMILLWQFYRQFSGIRIKFGQFKSLLMAPAAESITRARRKVQTEHPDLKPTQRVVRKRKVNEEACRDYYGQGILSLDHYMED